MLLSHNYLAQVLTHYGDLMAKKRKIRNVSTFKSHWVIGLFRDHIKKKVIGGTALLSCLAWFANIVYQNTVSIQADFEKLNTDTTKFLDIYESVSNTYISSHTSEKRSTLKYQMTVFDERLSELYRQHNKIGKLEGEGLYCTLHELTFSGDKLLTQFQRGKDIGQFIWTTEKSSAFRLTFSQQLSQEQHRHTGFYASIKDYVKNAHIAKYQPDDCLARSTLRFS